MKYAVVETGGKQYKTQEGEVLMVEKLTGKEKDKIEFDKVLLVKTDDQLLIGNPFLKNAKVKAEIVRQFKDKKIRIARFKAKSRYRKVKGHRQEKTEIKISKIVTN
jgi:large subunit ribosomal protein L21